MTNEESTSAMTERIVDRALSEANSRGGAPTRNATMPTDTMTGGYEDENGEWHRYWCTGDPVGSLPIGP